MRPLTIRRTLNTLFLLLGAALCLAVGLEVAVAASEWREARELARSNLAREALAKASLALAEERTATYLSLSGAEGAVAEMRARTDEALASTEAALAPVQAGADRNGLAAVRADLSQIRGVAGGALDTRTARDAVADYAFSAYSDLVGDLLSLRLALLAREDPTDQATAAAFQARRYASLLLDGLALNRAILGRLAAGTDASRRAALLDLAERNRARMDFAMELLEQQTALASPEVKERLRALARIQPAGGRNPEDLVIAALAAGDVPSQDLLARWRATSDRAVEAGTALLDALFAESRARVEALGSDALRKAALWTALLALGVLGVAAGAGAVLHRILVPLERLRSAMLALAQGELDVALPPQGRNDEMGEMADALRVFKANAIRRARLQEGRLALHERLQEAYRQLRTDIDSAAAVQAALLPAPGRIGGVRFHGRLRPSHLVSGDSYDVLRQPNGPVHFFLVDVAGHGAAAALVSVAAHHALTQAILGRQGGDDLAATMARLNRDWPPALPYFTTILGEIRPDQRQAALVQAGHPSPILLRRGNGVEALGTGGLPIGVLPDAGFEEIRFGFGPGDRLLLFSDGLTEAESAAGEAFGEDRLLGLLAGLRNGGNEDLLAALGEAARDWQGSDEPADDMTILILEAIDDEHDRGIPWRPSGAADA